MLPATRDAPAGQGGGAQQIDSTTITHRQSATGVRHSPVDRVLDALQARGVPIRDHRSYWMAGCPSHDDRAPSLSIREGDDGRALIHCHAGCSFDAVLADLGLERADVRVDTRAPSEPDAVYRYTDEAGAVLFEKVRLPGKQFRQRRPDGRGGFTYRLGDVRRVLYRLPEVVDAIAAGDHVLVVEGEKDADAATRVGYTATTNPEGAATPGQRPKWRTEYTETLRGAHVVVVPDRDPPGYAHGLAIVAALDGIAADVRIAEALSGKDLSDHLAAGHTIEDLAELTIDELRQHAAAPLDCEPASESDPSVIEFEWIPDPLIVTPPRFLVKQLLAESTHGELAGDKKALKSYLATSISVGGALGLDVLGEFSVPKAFRVTVLIGEGGKDLFLRRLSRIVEGYGATIDDLRPMLRFTTRTAPASSTALRDAISRELDEHQPALVVLDPWYAFASLEADARNLYETGRVLNDLRELVCHGPTSLMIANHFNQTGTGTGLERITMAGHAEWCDSWWLVNHRARPDVEAGRFRLTMQVGSRQWGGTSVDVDYDIGRFDPETGTHDGAIAWRVHRSSLGAGTVEHDLGQVLEFVPKAVAACKAATGSLSGRELLPLMGKGTDERKRAAVGYAVRAGCIAIEDGPRRRVDHRYVRDWTHDDADELRTVAGIITEEVDG